MASFPTGWALTESDPLLFTQLLRDFGVHGLQVDDLYSLDPETVAPLKPIHALIFLFKYAGNDGDQVEVGELVPADLCDIWFARQVANNSCGTVAALNAVMNIEPRISKHEGESIGLGERLKDLLRFGENMSAGTIGMLVASHPEIREVHNSFSQSAPFSIDHTDSPDREKEDPYHFVAYVPYKGGLYELDGLKNRPLYHGAVEDTDDTWVDKAREAIFAKIETYPAGSVMFNLLAIRGAAIPRLTRVINDPLTPECIKKDASEQLARERAKEERGRRENALRRHNLLPAVFALFKALGETGAIDPAVEQARAKGKERREKRSKEEQ